MVNLGNSENLSRAGKIEFSVYIPDLNFGDIEKMLKKIFPEMILNGNGNLILNLREDPACTKDLLVRSLACPSNCVIWQGGGLTEEDLTIM